jgi:hypothetical protein
MEAQANTQRHVLTQPPLRYLLECSNGSIIITSRNKGVASEIVGYKKNLINVRPMNTAEALVLMRKKLDECAEREELAQLVEELEFLCPSRLCKRLAISPTVHPNARYRNTSKGFGRVIGKPRNFLITRKNIFIETGRQETLSY